MKTLPILFSGPMVRAILEVRKTQSRRVVKCPRQWAVKYPTLNPYVMADPWITFFQDPAYSHVGVSVECPYGKPGDQLWVREPWANTSAAGVSKVPWYRADLLGHDEATPPPAGLKWRPAIFMNRLDSRITLEIVRVRVERLQDISEEDAKAEGITRVRFDDNPLLAKLYRNTPPMYPCWDKSGKDKFYKPNAVESYHSLWESINGKKNPWVSNPWVWVIEFKKVD